MPRSSSETGWATRALLAAACVLGLATLTGCPPKYPACKGDKDCRAGEFCVDNQCQQCRDARDCKEGQTCNKGRCEDKPPCTDDAQCPSGQSCIAGKCKPCASDNECGEGGRCDKGRCARGVVKPGGEDTGETQATGPCKLEPIYFDFNESALSTEATSAIERDADCLKKAGTQKATLAGHTDPRGTEEYNLALSERRAQAVRDRLSRLGIDSSRLKLNAKGELDATGTDESGWVKDRRVDVSW